MCQKCASAPNLRFALDSGIKKLEKIFVPLSGTDETEDLVHQHISSTSLAHFLNRRLGAVAHFVAHLSFRQHNWSPASYPVQTDLKKSIFFSFFDQVPIQIIKIEDQLLILDFNNLDRLVVKNRKNLQFFEIFQKLSGISKFPHI